jgi:NAD-dependent DNA ligase
MTHLLNSKNPDEIAEFLEKASIAYYNTSTPIITDDIYDILIEKLIKLAPKHPILSKIGAVEYGDKVDLPYWMGSLTKIRDASKSLDKWKKIYTGQSILSDKLDGNSGLFVCNNNKYYLYTRGDGLQGQNISNLIQLIPSFPKNLKSNIAVRGELIISKDNWNTLHSQHPEYSNPRNLVAGILHSKTPDPNIVKYVDFVAYELLNPKVKPSDSIKIIRDNGFITVYSLVKNNDSITSESLSQLLIQRRQNSPYEIDGVVVYNDDIFRTIKGKNPKYAFAFKSILTHEEAEVIVTNVEWNVSKDGYIKPTVLFNPVVISGVTIQKATGFNASFIENNIIGVGARIIIIRSGDVIPHIIRIITPASKPDFPDIPYKWNDTHIDIVTSTENLQQSLSVLEHFVKTLDIKFVATGVLKKFIDAGFNTIPKLMNITSDDIIKIDGFKKTSADKIAKSILTTRNNIDCIKLMTASNIFGRGLGVKKIQLIISKYPDILNRNLPTITDIMTVNGIGKTTAEAFLQNIPDFYKLIDEIHIPCHTESKKKSDSSNKFKDMKIVFSGFRDKELEQLITSNGGEVTNSISKNTSILIVKDIAEKSTKIDKARQLNIRIITKEQFLLI